MKWIKKVNTTPLDNVAQVINSLISGADATTNAPSIKAVNDALALKADENDLLQAETDLTSQINTKADKSNMFLLRTYSYEYTLGAGEIIQISASDFGISSITGYTPIAFREISAGSRYANVFIQYARVSGTVVAIRNTHSAEITNTVEIRLVFAKNELINS